MSYFPYSNASNSLWHFVITLLGKMELVAVFFFDLLNVCCPSQFFVIPLGVIGRKDCDCVSSWAFISYFLLYYFATLVYLMCLLP